MAAFGNVVMIGDSLFRGDADASPAFYSPAQELKALLTAGGHTATFAGNQLAWPGNIPCCSNGGRTIANIDADRANVVAADPDTIILQIGTNVIGVSTPNVGTQITNYLNNLYSDLGSSVR